MVSLNSCTTTTTPVWTCRGPHANGGIGRYVIDCCPCTVKQMSSHCSDEPISAAAIPQIVGVSVQYSNSSRTWRKCASWRAIGQPKGTEAAAVSRARYTPAATNRPLQNTSCALPWMSSTSCRDGTPPNTHPGEKSLGASPWRHARRGATRPTAPAPASCQGKFFTMVIHVYCHSGGCSVVDPTTRRSIYWL